MLTGELRARLLSPPHKATVCRHTVWCYGYLQCRCSLLLVSYSILLVGGDHFKLLTVFCDVAETAFER